MDVLALGDVINCISDEIIMRILLSHRFLLLSMLVLACSSDRRDPLIPTGGGPGAGRANLVVDDSNRYAAMQGIFEDIRGLCNKALGVISDPEAGQYTRVMGKRNGYALFSELNPNTTIVAPDVKLDFVNYFSDTGKLFYYGRLELVGQWRYTDGVQDQQLNKFIVNGTLHISGDYACNITFIDFQMALDPNGLDQGLVTIYSGSITVRFWTRPS